MSACSCSHTNSNIEPKQPSDNTSQKEPSFVKKVPKTYELNRIECEKIYSAFDEDYNYDSFDLRIEELDVTLNINGKEIYKNGNKKEFIGLYEMFFLADVNFDGYRDFCLVKPRGSGVIRYYVDIIDYKNDEVLFTNDMEDNSYYWLAEESGYLVLAKGLNNNSPYTNKMADKAYISYDVNKGVVLDWANFYNINKLDITFYESNDSNRKLAEQNSVVSISENRSILVDIKIIGGDNFPKNDTINLFRFSNLKIIGSKCFDNNHDIKILVVFNDPTTNVKIGFSGLNKEYQIVVNNSDKPMTKLKQIINPSFEITSNNLSAFEIRKEYNSMFFNYYEGSDSKTIQKGIELLDNFIYEMDKDLYDVFIKNQTNNYEFLFYTKYKIYSFKNISMRYISYGDKYYFTEQTPSYYDIDFDKYMFREPDEQVFAHKINDDGLIEIENLSKIVCKKIGYSTDLETIYEIPGDYTILIFDKKTFAFFKDDHQYGTFEIIGTEDFSALF